MNSALAEFLRITQDPGTVQYWYSVRCARVSRARPHGNLRQSPKGEDPPKRRGVLIMILILVLYQ